MKQGPPVLELVLDVELLVDVVLEEEEVLDAEVVDEALDVVDEALDVVDDALDELLEVPPAPLLALELDVLDRVVPPPIPSPVPMAQP